jgi:signal transduction histidine kinase
VATISKPRPLEGPTARPGGIPRGDVLFALFLGGLQLLGTYGATEHQSAHREFDALAAVLVLIGPAALVVRRHHPVAVLAITFGSVLAYWCAGYAHGPIFLGLIVAYVNAVRYGHRVVAWASLPIGWVTFLWLPELFGTRSGPSVAGAVGLAAWLLVLGAVTELVSARRQHHAELARTAAAESRQRASDERLRIARDLHDVVAHNISLINVRAGVALHLIDEQPEEARVALTAIKQASREALGELRWVLDSLRGDGEVAPRAPAPRLDDLPELVGRTSAAGLPARLEMHGTRRPVGSAVESAAFRIVQEALTNVTRHAQATEAVVEVDFGPRALTVQVDDDGVGAPPAGDGGRNGSVGGSGIIGMRERVAALDGVFEAAPRAGGGFRVRAVLPIPPEVETETSP